MDYSLIYYAVFYALNAILAVIVIFFERRKPRSVIIWLLLLFLIPALGFILYLLFGRRPGIRGRRSRINAERDRRSIDNLVQKNLIPTLKTELPKDDGNLGEYGGLARMLVRYHMFLTEHNDARIITEGDEKFKALFEMVQGAKHHVHVEYYIIRDDALGKQFLNLLIAKAREGVEVRLLFDDVGTSLPKELLMELEQAGGQYARFFPSLVPHIALLNFNLNYRNHRKIVVIDGKVGMLGGFNVGEEYIGGDKRLGHWRDTQLVLRGDAVLAMQLRFLLDWNVASEKALGFQSKYFPAETDAKGGGAAQIVSSGPLGEPDEIKESYLKMALSGRERIYIQTPYFIPDQSILDALRIAALSGVDVRIMVPHKKDHMLVHWANSSYLGELLEAGVRWYYYENGFLHAKTMVVDGKIVSIGSANWDIRSFELNFETNAISYDPRVAQEQERIFLEDQRSCTEVTAAAYGRRSVMVKMRESISRLFSPVL